MSTCRHAEAFAPARLFRRKWLKHAGNKIPLFSSHWTGGLTERQIDVMTLYAQGMNTKGIAMALRLSPKTVEFHRNSLFMILRLRSFAELVKMAVAFNLVKL